jgi:hypothetical protein
VTMTTAATVRCPGPNGNGCGAMLAVDADYCYSCERIFFGDELYIAWERQNP